MKSRLFSLLPAKLAGTRSDEAVMAETVRDASAVLFAQNWLAVKGNSLSQQNFRGEWGWNVFTCEPTWWAILPFFAHGQKPAGGWHIYGHTCWVRVGGLITGWQKIKMIWWIMAVVTTQWDEARVYSVPSAWRRWGVAVILFKSHSSASS